MGDELVVDELVEDGVATGSEAFSYGDRIWKPNE